MEQIVTGQRIGNYELTERLGQGGMGMVWRARDTQLERDVAIKMILPNEDPATAKETITRFMIEARAAAAIKSRYVAQVLQLGQLENGQAYIVMELLEGETLLTALLRERRFPCSRVVRIARHIARGLKAAHALHIIHRDLKPANIMLVRGDDGLEEAKVLDFGVAKRLRSSDQQLTAKGHIYGTLHFMAPEQINTNEVDHRTDVYALGCLMYRMLSGRDPFEADGMGALALQITMDDPPPLTDHVIIPEGLEDVVLKCLAKKPEHRFQSMDELDAALGRFDGVPDHEDTQRFVFNGKTEDAVRPTEAIERNAFGPAPTVVDGAFANTSQIASPLLPPPRMDTPSTAPTPPSPKVEVFSDAQVTTSPTVSAPRAAPPHAGPESGDFDAAVLKLQATRKRNALIAAAVVGVVVIAGVSIAALQSQSREVDVAAPTLPPVEDVQPSDSKPADDPKEATAGAIEQRVDEKVGEKADAKVDAKVDEKVDQKIEDKLAETPPAETKPHAGETKLKPGAGKKPVKTKRTKDEDGFIRVRTDGT